MDGAIAERVSAGLCLLYPVVHTSDGVEVGYRKGQFWSEYMMLRSEHEHSITSSMSRIFLTQPCAHEWKLYMSAECASRRWWGSARQLTHLYGFSNVACLIKKRAGYGVAERYATAIERCDVEFSRKCLGFCCHCPPSMGFVGGAAARLGRARPDLQPERAIFFEASRLLFSLTSMLAINSSMQHLCCGQRRVAILIGKLSPSLSTTAL